MASGATLSPMRPSLALPTLLCLLAASCNPPEGERRPLVAYHLGPSPAPKRVEGEEVFFDGNWVKDGPVTFYDKAGNVTHRGDYALGLESGQWTEMGADGITGTGSYREGERHGRWEYRYASDQVQSEGSYDMGRRTGLWTTYYSDGSKESEKPYVGGQLEGTVKVYDPLGNLEPMASGTFRKGERIK